MLKEAFARRLGHHSECFIPDISGRFLGKQKRSCRMIFLSPLDFGSQKPFSRSSGYEQNGYVPNNSQITKIPFWGGCPSSLIIFFESLYAHKNVVFCFAESLVPKNFYNLSKISIYLADHNEVYSWVSTRFLREIAPKLQHCYALVDAKSL